MAAQREAVMDSPGEDAQKHLGLLDFPNRGTLGCSSCSLLNQGGDSYSVLRFSTLSHLSGPHINCLGNQGQVLLLHLVCEPGCIFCQLNISSVSQESKLYIIINFQHSGIL
ncbi:hypothetical protein FGO68_gene10413 [Halteria grandinella]|uniref:Uncharacterized protein n=1 Tax=Halteria grandinella TaxID=5974 RepID=A0A8J8SYT3_HALGN|nr:hypothetical protein FGO68_gene10413 [Halteria grandinella]